jgi:hypothetical protein
MLPLTPQYFSERIYLFERDSHWSVAHLILIVLPLHLARCTKVPMIRHGISQLIPKRAWFLQAQLS